MPSFKHVLLSRRLATLADIRHEQALDKMYRLEAEVDALFLENWNNLLKIIVRSPDDSNPLAVGAAHVRIVNLLTDLGDSLLLLLTKRFLGIVQWTYDRSFEIFAHTLDETYWTFLQRKFVESADFKVSVDPDTARALYKPPSKEQALEIIRTDHPLKSGVNWEQRIQQLSSKANPQQIAQRVALGLQDGQNPIKVARAIRRDLQLYKSGAERIARTEMLRVSNAVAKDSWESTFGDVVAGYQIRETLDTRTRTSHAARHGDIYVKDQHSASFPGALPIAQLPVLPDAPNCRGSVSPVLLPEDNLFGDFVKQSKVASVDGPIDDPGTYSAWFNQQDEKRQKRVVGTKRFNIVTDKLNGQPLEFAHFIDPITQKIMPIKALQAEDLGALLVRAAQNRTDFERILKAINSLFTPASIATSLPPGIAKVANEPTKPDVQDPDLDTDKDRGISPLEI